MDELADKIRSQWAKGKAAPVEKRSDTSVLDATMAAVLHSPKLTGTSVAQPSFDESKVKVTYPLDDVEKRLATIEKQLSDLAKHLDGAWTRIRWIEKQDDQPLSEAQLAKVAELLAASAGAKMAQAAAAEQLRLDKMAANRERQKRWRERQRAARELDASAQENANDAGDAGEPADDGASGSGC